MATSWLPCSCWKTEHSGYFTSRSILGGILLNRNKHIIALNKNREFTNSNEGLIKTVVGQGRNSRYYYFRYHRMLIWNTEYFSPQFSSLILPRRRVLQRAKMVKGQRRCCDAGEFTTKRLILIWGKIWRLEMPSTTVLGPGMVLAHIVKIAQYVCKIDKPIKYSLLAVSAGHF